MQYIDNKAELCPVCNGSGKYITTYNYGTTCECGTEITCHGCGGVGWVIVPTYKTSITRG